MPSSSRLAKHLEERYGIAVIEVTELDVGVLHARRDDGPSWVARVFPESRPLDAVQGDARILIALERAGFPAERCAHRDAVSSFERQGVLVTEFLEGRRAEPSGRTYAVLGVMLGRLHAEAAPDVRDGGSWHRLSPIGGPREEKAAALALLEDALARVAVRELPLYERLREEIEKTDDCHDLPHAFVHPDFVPANAIATADERLVIVDWTCAGRGARLWSLGFLLWAAGARSPKLVEVVVSRYRRHVRLEHAELARLAAAIRGRPVMLQCWSFCAGRSRLPEVVERVSRAAERADAIARWARQGLEQGWRDA